MDWTESLQKAIAYMEKNLLENISADDVARQVNISSFYFQKGFHIMTGYSVGEYLRNRRLYLAALDIAAGTEKVIEAAFKYGYETPESFTKAFCRFHGRSPAQIRKDASAIKTFLPLKISILIQGGLDMDYTLEKMDAFSVIGFEREFSFENSYQEIPRFWDEFAGKYAVTLAKTREPQTDAEKAVGRNMVGEFGICLDDKKTEGTFRYLIAGVWQGGEVPKGMTVVEIPGMEWAKFTCTGPMPKALQSVNTKIFQEWLPQNRNFKIAMDCSVEWYSMGDMGAVDYKSAIWIPVERI